MKDGIKVQCRNFACWRNGKTADANANRAAVFITIILALTTAIFDG